MEYQKRNVGIYLLTNIINNKIYVGKSQNLSRRTSDYRFVNKKWFGWNSLIVKAIKKYGWENFKVDILESFTELDDKRLLDKEADWIMKLNSTNREIGYNLCVRSTSRFGFKMSQETRKKISRSLKEHYKNNPNPLRGRARTQEVKDKISKHHKENKISVGEKNPIFGIKRSNETKQKISQTRIEKNIGAGDRNPFWGKKHTEETRQKMREGSKNKTNETLRKPVLQIDKDSGEVIREWVSSAEVGRVLGLHSSNISGVCRGKMKTYKGFVWRFKN